MTAYREGGRDWSDIVAESDRVIDQAMAEAHAYDADCTCCAVDVEGASHLEWCAVLERRLQEKLRRKAA